MKIISILTALALLIFAADTSSARNGEQHRVQPQARLIFPVYRMDPARQHISPPRIVNVPQTGKLPQHDPYLGPHGRPMMTMKDGSLREMHNLSRAWFVPGSILFVPGGGNRLMTPDEFIDGINLSLPPLPFSNPCGGPCTAFGAMSISNDGAFGTAWNYADIENANAVAQAQCMESATEPCSTMSMGAVMGNTQWMAALQCTNQHWHQGLYAVGNNAPDAITNAYRVAVQGGYFARDDCALVALIAADGSHERVQGNQAESME